MANAEKTAHSRNDAQSNESDRSAKSSAGKRRIPPPGPSNWVTDGFPYRRTDPRNWPKVAEDAAEFEPGSPSS